jgi:hypothetical protein
MGMKKIGMKKRMGIGDWERESGAENATATRGR